MTKEEILKEINDEITTTKDWLEDVMDDITEIDDMIRYARVECNTKINTLECVLEQLENMLEELE